MTRRHSKAAMSRGRTVVDVMRSPARGNPVSRETPVRLGANHPAVVACNKFLVGSVVLTTALGTGMGRAAAGSWALSGTVAGAFGA
jgi:hypothetical protein